MQNLEEWKVLQVEDDAVCAFIMRHRLHQIIPNATFMLCSHERCVEELLSSEGYSPDIVLIDYALEHGDMGTNVLRFIRSISKDTPPLFVSVTSNRDIHSGFDIYWSKPYPSLPRTREQLLVMLASRSPKKTSF